MSQRMLALRKANQIRTQRAKIKHSLKSGTPLKQVLDDPSIQSMRVADLLAYMPGNGRKFTAETPNKAVKRGHKLAREAGIVNGKLVGELTDRQREALAKEVAG